MLIHAAAGGVGHIAVQLAKWKGAHVIGTAAARNHDLLRKLGADQVVDYDTERFEEVVQPVDVVLDTMGGDTQARSWKVLKRGGILVSIAGQPSAEIAAAHRVRQAFVFTQPNPASFRCHPRPGTERTRPHPRQNSFARDLAHLHAESGTKEGYTL